tara:strand:+ start:132 stop:527 length:396 start_codon:yes stop_codon:yes gene_type:complete
MANVEEILGQIDDGIENYKPIIANLQNQYFENNGRYWQGLFTHSTAPIDENSEAPDRLGDRPTDQDSSWQDIAGDAMPSEMLSRIRIDTYESPEGHGYIIIAEKTINSDSYRRMYNVGPESGRSSEWEKLS